jgi:hypothetical protein
VHYLACKVQCGCNHALLHKLFTSGFMCTFSFLGHPLSSFRHFAYISLPIMCIPHHTKHMLWSYWVCFVTVTGYVFLTFVAWSLFLLISNVWPQHPYPHPHFSLLVPSHNLDWDWDLPHRVDVVCKSTISKAWHTIGV